MNGESGSETGSIGEPGKVVSEKKPLTPLKTAAEISQSENRVEKTKSVISSEEIEREEKAKQSAEALFNSANAGAANPTKEALPPIPPERRAELEAEYGKALTDDQIRLIDQAEFEQQVRIKAALKAQAELEAEGGHAERKDPYTGLTDEQLLALPWDEAQGYQPLPQKKGFITIRLRDQMRRQYWVYWPDGTNVDADGNKVNLAQDKVRDVLGRIELARVNLNEDPDLNDEYQSILWILGTLERSKKTNKRLELGADKSGRTIPLENSVLEEGIKTEADKRIKEFRARNAFRGAFLNYEMQSDNGVVLKEARQLFDPEYLNTLFEIDEVVEALQYYEDNGFRFAEHNSNEGRDVFAVEVLMHLTHLEAVQKGLAPGSEEYKKFIADNHQKYKWAQFLAERTFRFTGRACEYEHLVINKGKENQQRVTWQYEGSERPQWASGGSGCDYEMRKHERFRDFLRQEKHLSRAQIKLLNRFDLYARDFFTSSVPGAPGLKVLDDKDNSQAPIVKNSQQELDELDFLVYKVAKVRTFNTETKEYEWTDRFLEADRNTDDNKGERVGRINFKKIKETGYTFRKMDDTPMGLWTTRFLEGPDKARKALTGDDGFMTNPNFNTLKKHTSTFDYEKGTEDNQTLAELRAHAFTAKETLAENLVPYLKNDRHTVTGKQNSSDEEIIAGLNNLAGLNKEDEMPFFGLTEWARIMRKEMGVVLPEKAAAIEEDLKKFENEDRDPVKELERREQAKELAKTVMAGIQNKLEKRFGTKFSFWFIFGAFQGFIKGFLEQLGIKI